jgi:recombination associated protein RdgC
VFKNAVIYGIARSNPLPAMEDIEERLQARAFAECAPTQRMSTGFVPPRGEKHGALVENIGGELIMRIATETRAVPGPIVKRELDKRLDQIQQETGRRPKGKRAKEVKEEILHEMLPKAFPRRASMLAWLSPNSTLLVLDASGSKRADDALSLLADVFGSDCRFHLLQTQTTATSFMASSLLDESGVPAGFGIDRECELKQPDSEKASVRYSRHNLDMDEVREHIKQGKLPTRLAMTWSGRVSFVLTEALVLKKLQLLDVVFESASSESEADAFDTDVAIFTGEMRRFIPDLVDALGGQLEITTKQPAQ